MSWPYSDLLGLRVAPESSGFTLNYLRLAHPGPALLYEP